MLVQKSNPYKILIIAPSWVGDLVMSQTLFKALKEQYQERLQLDIFANNWASEILTRMPEINQVIINPFTHGKLELFKRIKLGLSLRNKHYDQVFVLPNSFKSAILPFFAGIKKRTGFVGETRYGLLNDIYSLDKEKLPLMIERFCALANHGIKPSNITWPNLIIDEINQQHLIQKHHLNNDQQIIAICPAAEYGPSKRWPPEYFALLSDSLINQGYQIIILGSAKDTAISKTILHDIQSKSLIFDLCGKTSLADAVDLLAKASYVVTNDSGLMHIACTVGSKVLALYGSSSPNFTPPLSNTAKIMHIELNCSPCFQRTCRFNHYNCLRFITPEMVLDKLKEF